MSLVINTSKKKLREMILDERRATKNYARRGYPTLAHDEHKHLLFLKKQLNKKK